MLTFNCLTLQNKSRIKINEADIVAVATSNNHSRQTHVLHSILTLLVN